jgi:transcription-repair coupling factor (superfamily II helicase)
VTNLLGLLKPFPAFQNIKRLFLELEVGANGGRDKILDTIEEYGYTREDLVNSAGEYAWRGGVVDVFSPWHSYPYRVEFSGDEIASIREFDTSTQRSIKKIDRLMFPSLREFPSSPQFFREWEELAQARGGTAPWKDTSDKISLVKQGDLFPSFFYLSLLHTEHFVPFTHYLRNYLFIIDNFEETEKEWEENSKDLREQYAELKKQKKFALSPEEIYSPSLWETIKKEGIQWRELSGRRGKKTFSFPFQSVPQFKNKIPFFIQYLKKLQKERERCLIYFSSQDVRQKFASLLSQHQISHIESSNPFIFPKDGAIVLLVGDLIQGFRYPEEKISVFSERDIITEEKVIVSRPRVRSFLSHFQDLKAGDYVVHTDYGIGIFKGLIKLDIDKRGREFIEITYRDEDKLFVPVEDLNLVQKYSTLGSSKPLLNKLGTLSWEKTKTRTKKAIEKMAKELLQLYAQRKAIQGFNYSPGGTWQSEFERTFAFEETEDQLKAIKEIMNDMESEPPMDRLLCGDVGYGKTEVGIRASFKAVMDGKQVAVLCPTTVLASQHLQTFRERMVLFPVRIEGLTRFQTKGQQSKIIEDIKKGLVDIVIGTHRLLYKDVQFHDLGLLIIDEEQRFGVHHKEKIKKMKTDIDVLTMSATPIPRTLNLSLTGIRDISLIETPPKDRLAIHTVVTPFSPKLIASAIKMELARKGQVYFIHNRIEDIDKVARIIGKFVPQAKITIVHGKMPSAVLEKRMIDFINQKSNVLVSTTIIENGIDIPLVNTLIVERADLFGLSQLYQLRGRVGRSSRQAVAYFLVPPYSALTRLARERLKALQEFTELGSGFRLAAKDLEIRGAGNFLGSEQHGYMEAVGFDYYMHLLEQTIKELKGEAREEIKSEINLRVDIRIPESYLPQINLRLNLYKRVSSVENLGEIEKIKSEIKDRYGLLPRSVRNLLRYGVIKFLAQRIKIRSIDRVGKRIVVKFLPTSSANLTRLTGLVKKYSGSITPQGVMNLTMRAERETQIMDETTSILKELSLM